jgi:peptide/nickel transport system substrate-binding protein
VGCAFRESGREPLFVPDELIMISRRFSCIEPAPIGIGRNIIKWYVPKDEKKYTMTR